LIRIPAAEAEYCRMELRSPDPSCNPYLAFALVIQAGLEGINKQIPLTPAFDANLYEADADRINGLTLIPEKPWRGD